MNKLKLHVFSILFFYLLLPVGASEAADTAEQNIKALNHLNLSLYRIANYNNKAVLDDEYDTINNDLKLDAIADKKLVDIIQELMDALTSFKISEKERARMQAAYEQMQEDLVMNVVRSGISSAATELQNAPLAAAQGALRTGNPLGAAAALMASVPNVAASVTKPLAEMQMQSQKIEDFDWNLDIEKLKSLNELNKKFLATYWEFLHDSNVPDALRISEKQIRNLLSTNRDKNPITRYRMLVRLEKECGHIPAYWYYRADAANDILQQDTSTPPAKRAELVTDVASCLARYQEELGILRKDNMLANLRMLHLATASLDPEEARKEIAAVVEPFPLDASKRLFAALNHLKYGQKAEAIEHLNANIDMGQYETISRKLLSDIYAENHDEPKEAALVQKLLGDASASNQEILYHLGKLQDYEKFMVELAPRLSSIKMEVKTNMVGDDDIEIVLPPKWDIIANAGGKPATLVVGKKKLQSDTIKMDDDRQIRLVFKKAVKNAELAAQGSVPVRAEIATRHFPIILDGTVAFLEPEAEKQKGVLGKFTGAAKKLLPTSNGSFQLDKISCEDVVFRNENGKWMRQGS